MLDFKGTTTKDTKTLLTTDRENNLIAFARIDEPLSDMFKGINVSKCDTGFLVPYKIMPDIKDVTLISECDSRIVIVTFYDGTSEKAVLGGGDEFDMEQGIAVCITKRLLSGKCPNGSNLYNKIIRRAMRIYNNKVDNEYRAAQKEKEESERRERKRKKREQRRINRKASEREKQIEIYKEAYLRALSEYGAATN